ncbi:hypothetical protein ACFYXQ_03600 [Nocardia jiangxiensis]|uniref:Uncharacterized protein n=1 Tax=Nocardia jiangxiensis TaxID=282685 RepID=A0ABW6RS50_9NOCA
MGKGARRKRKQGHREGGAGTHVSFGGARGRNQAEMDAVERACDDDRRWFESNPFARRRIRVAWPEEFTAELGEPCPQGHRIVVSVEEVAPGVRVRNPLEVVALLPGHEELTEVQISDVVRGYVEYRTASGLPDLVADEIRAGMADESDTAGMYSAMYDVARRGR